MPEGEPQRQGMVATYGPGIERQATLGRFGGVAAPAISEPREDLRDVLAGGLHHLVVVTGASVSFCPVDPAACDSCGEEIGYTEAQPCGLHQKFGLSPHTRHVYRRDADV